MGVGSGMSDVRLSEPPGVWRCGKVGVAEMYAPWWEDAVQDGGMEGGEASQPEVGVRILERAADAVRRAA